MKRSEEEEALAMQSTRLLLIGDDVSDRKRIEDLLARAPRDRYAIDWACSTEELPDCVRNCRYDAILIDHRLESQGVEALVTELEALCDQTAVIVLTDGDLSDAEEAVCRMPVDFLLSKKELSVDGLDRAVRYAIRNRDQQMRLRNFARLVAHDLKGPLGNVRSAAEMLAMLLPDLSGDPRELLEVLRSDCENLESTLEALHEYSASQGGRLESKTIPLQQVLQAALCNLGMPDALEEGKVVCEGLPSVAVDAGLFTQVFQNLIRNALQYNASSKPSVRISAVSALGCCELKFADNGIGVDPRKAKDVFRPMYRLHGTAAYEGTGLGLTVCKGIVERHGGRIWLESSGIEGEGSTVYIRLVVAPDSQASSTAEG
ncbi:ATP-binding protein [Pelagicoccus sp. SDUM812005]|uniref:sensor histidine kinase n=1 Tax=Pelagicoccus sp. SDUM812005 TaxID=3041257 RepID=UPI00280E5EF9|nr:ATP-binding protein [Pelagicoccus sp. SDUM812005]MDQ8181055.1 ATP-binding protein [Pelagicoccus sp. SDUM812005]